MTATEHVAPISPGKPGAPVGSREWADWFRTLLVSEVQQLGKQDAGLAGKFAFLKEHRAWTLMNKPDGSFFGTVEEFCAFRRPYGLGTPWETLKPYLVAGMAKDGKSADEIERTLQLETVPPAKAPKPGPGRGKRKEASAQEETTAHDEPSFSDAAGKRLRAITRAPEAVRDAYREGRISQTLAAKLGPKDPDADTAAQIAEVAREIRALPDRKRVDAVVRERLGVRAPSAVDRALAAVDRLTEEQRVQFFERVESMRLASKAYQMTGMK